MTHKGIEYKVMPTTTPGVWAWSVQPPKSMPIQGSAKSVATATANAKRAIEKWLEASAEEAADC